MSEVKVSLDPDPIGMRWDPQEGIDLIQSLLRIGSEVLIAENLDPPNKLQIRSQKPVTKNPMLDDRVQSLGCSSKTLGGERYGDKVPHNHKERRFGE